MQTKALLLGSVSIIATTAAAPGVAHAATDAVKAPEGFTYSVQGGVLFSGVDSDLQAFADDKAGSGFDTTVDDFSKQTGFNAAITVGKKLDNMWDIQFGASINKLNEVTGEVTYSGASSFYDIPILLDNGILTSPPLFGALNGLPFPELSGFSFSGFGSGSASSSGFMRETSSFAFQTFDFEVGYTPVMQDDFNVRLFAGIRALRFTSNMTRVGEFSSSESFHGWGDASGFGGSGFGYLSGYVRITEDFSDTFKSEFFGAGPRIGGQFSKRFDSSPFGISGTVAAAAIYGRQTDTETQDANVNLYASYYFAAGSGFSVSGSFSSGAPVTHNTYTETAEKWVLDIQAKSGVDYYLNDATKLTVGYQAELLTNVGPIGEDKQNKLVHGPFVAVGGSF